jgi:hypothetical protein
VPSAPWTAELFAPFGHGEASTGREATGLRPLWRSVATDTVERLEVLYPIYRHHREETAFASRLMPFWWRDRILTPGGWDTDTAIAPILWWGHEPGQGNYFLFFPFGGTVKQKFLMDEGTFVLFPAYLRSRNGNFHGNHVLWPLVHWGSGDGRSAFRVLPFWSQSDKEGVYRRRSVAWPIVHWGEEHLDTDDPHRRWLVFPFYGRETSERTSSTTLLWPFFQWSDGPKSTARDLPFPFHRRRITRDDSGAVETELRWNWPFYGSYTAPKERSEFWMWPFVHRQSDETFGRRHTGFYVAPFWVNLTNEATDGSDGSTFWKAWPFASGGTRADGASQWSALAPLPLLRWEEFEANWGIFFELARHRRDADGSTATDLLFSLIRHRSDPDGGRFRVPGIFSQERREESSSWKVLEGLVGGESSPEKGSSLRLLWFLRIPLSAPAGGGDAE